jgi:hypothetical protein
MTTNRNPSADPILTTKTVPLDTAAINQIAEWLRLFIAPDQITELRCLPRPVACGFFDYDHLSIMAHEAWNYSFRSQKSVYFTPNALKPELLNRRKYNVSLGFPKGGMSDDKDVLSRRYLLIDADPIRAEGHEDDSATDTEKQYSHDLATHCAAVLANAGFASPLWVDSGNGWHLYYATNHPTTAIESESVVGPLLQGLVSVCDTPQAKIDVKVKNLSRIMRVPGTMSAKGVPTADRPHRVSTVTVVPANWGKASTDLAKGFATLGKQYPGVFMVDGDAKPRTKKPSQSHPRPPSVPSKRATETTVWGQHALDSECAKLRTAKPGSRNSQVFASSRCVGELVAGGEVEESQALAALYDAANATGLPADEIAKAIAGGFAKGQLTPRRAPNREDEDVICPDIPQNSPLPTAGADATAKTVPPQPSSQPSPPTPQADPNYVPKGPTQLRNTQVGKNEKGDDVDIGKPLREIAKNIYTRANGWPKVVGKQLFLPPSHAGSPPFAIKTADQLFAWLADVFPGEKGQGPPIDWRTGGGDKPTQSQLMEYLIQKCPYRHESLELYPHEPALPDVLYHHPVLPPSTGADLDEFCNFFLPASEIDACLIRAAIVTMFWGGPPGGRPGFMITATGGDSGRGAGKSTMAMKFAALVGGSIGIHPEVDKPADSILSENRVYQRVCLIDNLKSNHFSSATIEGIITNVTVDGRRLYIGSDSKPNHYTWFLTVNSPGLSKDFSQRFVPISICTPTYDPRWRRNIDAFIEARRWHIIADAIAHIKSPETSLARYSRFDDWSAAVVSKFANANEIIAAIAEEQKKFDGDAETADAITGVIEDALRRNGYDPDTQTIYFTPSILAKIIEGFCERRDTPSVMRFVFRQNIEKLSKYKSNGKRGAIWNAGKNDTVYEFVFGSPQSSSPFD